MRLRRMLFLAAHAVFAGFTLLTSFYCLLAYLPFTYHQVHKGGLLHWLDVFVRLHPWLYGAAAAVLAPELAARIRRREPGIWLAAGLCAYLFATSVALMIHPVLSRLENDLSSFCWSLLALLPLAWLAVTDIAAHARQVKWAEDPGHQTRGLFGAACGSALFVSLIYAIVSQALGPVPVAASQHVLVFGWSAFSHLLVFLALFLLLEWLAALAGLFRQPSQLEFWLCHLLAAVGIWALMRSVVCPPLGFEGWPATLFSIVLGLVLAGLHAGLALTTAPVSWRLIRSARSGAAVLAVVGVAGTVLAVKTAPLDWNYLLQKLVAVVIWSAAFACFCAFVPPDRRVRRNPVWLAVALAVLAAYKVVDASSPASGPLLERYAGYDVSFQFTRQLLRPHRQEDGSFYRFLARNTNIPRSVRVAPVAVNLVDHLSQSSGERPHIFIFTVDSLRPDYLSSYNRAVSFTPSIHSFASESTVFQNAFTRYGGTGLSEPAIWSGALLLHKQYITPFAPMNALEKLLRAEQYQVFLSPDSILSAILTPSPDTVEIDPPDSTMSYDFSRSLEKLAAAIDRRVADARPVFAYTQPQNLHVSVIQREGASVPAGETYPGFYAPYASRVKRIDAAFGKFIGFLKARGLYQKSVVVLTADHGDSLGEDGRWGHAYTLFPEIVRIPLMVHLPPDLEQRVSCDPLEPAFSTDITPSLYYLLGHRPIARSELFGRPLFTETAEERARDPQTSYLLASSYAAVYGILSGSGRWLYVADAVNYQDHLFDLAGPSPSSKAADAAIRSVQEKLIRQDILSLNRFYRFGEGRQEQQP